MSSNQWCDWNHNRRLHLTLNYRSFKYIHPMIPSHRPPIKIRRTTTLTTAQLMKKLMQKDREAKQRKQQQQQQQRQQQQQQPQPSTSYSSQPGPSYHVYPTNRPGPSSRKHDVYAFTSDDEAESESRIGPRSNAQKSLPLRPPRFPGAVIPTFKVEQGEEEDSRHLQVGGQKIKVSSKMPLGEVLKLMSSNKSRPVTKAERKVHPSPTNFPEIKFAVPALPKPNARRQRPSGPVAVPASIIDRPTATTPMPPPPSVADSPPKETIIPKEPAATDIEPTSPQPSTSQPTMDIPIPSAISSIAEVRPNAPVVQAAPEMPQQRINLDDSTAMPVAQIKGKRPASSEEMPPPLHTPPKRISPGIEALASPTPVLIRPSETLPTQPAPVVLTQNRSQPSAPAQSSPSPGSGQSAVAPPSQPAITQPQQVQLGQFTSAQVAALLQLSAMQQQQPNTQILQLYSELQRDMLSSPSTYQQAAAMQLDTLQRNLLPSSSTTGLNIQIAPQQQQSPVSIPATMPPRTIVQGTYHLASPQPTSLPMSRNSTTTLSLTMPSQMPTIALQYHSPSVQQPSQPATNSSAPMDELMAALTQISRSTQAPLNLSPQVPATSPAPIRLPMSQPAHTAHQPAASSYAYPGPPQVPPPINDFLRVASSNQNPFRAAPNARLAGPSALDPRFWNGPNQPPPQDPRNGDRRQ
ncbi:unnamed protein product, partial [Mesorhabditis spiculigera]